MSEIKNNSVFKKSKEKINEYVRLRIEKMLINYLQKQPKQIKEMLKDEHMCDCVKSSIDSLVDEFWPDIQSEIL